MSKRIRVEIKNLDTGEWQWMGWLNEDLLTQLTTYAGDLNDELESAAPTTEPSNKGK